MIEVSVYTEPTRKEFVAYQFEDWRIDEDGKVFGPEVCNEGVWLRFEGSPRTRTFYAWHRIHLIVEIEKQPD